MNYEFFIAKRIAFSYNREKLSSKPIIRIAIAAMAIGFAVMIIAIAVVSGFKKEIRDKVIGFGSHIQISNYDENNSYETEPVERTQPFINDLKKDKDIKHIQVFATKAGIIKTTEEIEGVVAKGVGSDFDWSYFRSRLTEGKIFTITDSVRTDSILISKSLAQKLNVRTGSDIIMHFIQQPPRVRKFKVAGVYQTGLEEFDNLFLFCDIAHIQKLNDWREEEVGGFEITVNDYSKLDVVGEKVYDMSGSDLNALTIKEVYPQIFDWLNLQNINAIIIISLMIVVSGMNMISALLIIILERINFIGTMKALGFTSRRIRKIFIYLSGYLISRGLLWGNLIGLTLIFLQKQFGLFTLDEKSYYITHVPVHFTWFHFAILNGGTLLVCMLMMIIPTSVVSGISPLKALRYT